MSSMIASALAIYTNLQSKDRQGFLTQSQTPSHPPPSHPAPESSPLPTGSKSTTDIPAVRHIKKTPTEKDTH
jgi:hypothetical protein